MSKYSYGISSFLVADIDPVTGMGINPIETKEAVYRDTFNVAEEEGTTTDHYSEMDSTPKVSFTEVGKETITLQLMETDTATLANYLGGNVVVEGGRNVWRKPSGQATVEKHITVETEDGVTLVYPRVKVTARKNFQLRRNGLWLLDVTMTVLAPLLPVSSPLAAVIVSDPVAP